MSRVAKAPVIVPTGIDVKIDGQVITTKGKNGELARTLNDIVEVKHADNTLTSGPRDGYANGWVQAGTARTLLNSVVIGVTEGFTKKLRLVGVGYRATVKGNTTNLSLGFSHLVNHQLSTGITTECPIQIEVVLKSADRQVIGQVAVDLRAYRRPEPYKGKDIRYADEVVCTKEIKKKQGNTVDKEPAHIRRATRARRKPQELGATRLVVHCTPRHIYARIIAPDGSGVLITTFTVEKAIAEQLKYTGNKGATATVGKATAERALEKGIKDASFGRSGFQYHGHVQTLTDAVREAGLQF